MRYLDKTLESTQQQVFALNVARLILHIYESGYSCTFGDAFRSPEQAALNATRGIGIKDSQHCKRLAVDLNLFSPSGKYCYDSKPYEAFGIYWEQLHDQNRWGGNFQRNDAGHFEMKD